MKKIQMVDLHNQYLQIKEEIDKEILQCITNSTFINGPQVKEFSHALAQYLNAEKVIPCANGTDALQIALMALGLKRGDEVIVPSFTYVATMEVIALLGLIPVMVDVDEKTFNITADIIENAIGPKTKAVVPVHLYGQSADMEPIMAIAKKYNLFVVEDNAQALGARYTFDNGTQMKSGTIGDIGCTSFFPSKNLGCYGDGGALYSNSLELAEKISMIANHGQSQKYVHKYIGVNSRLDSIQAAVLKVKLKLLDHYAAARQAAAAYYDKTLQQCKLLTIPYRHPKSTHVFHQYTIKVAGGKRDGLIQYLKSKDIPCMIYYPIPLNKQEAYQSIGRTVGSLEISESLCHTVLSLPIHTELTENQLAYITTNILDYLNN